MLLFSCGSGNFGGNGGGPGGGTQCSNAVTGSATDYSTSPIISGCPVFPTDNPWNADVSNYCVDPNSDQYIASINQDKQYLHPDFGTDPMSGIPFVVVPGTQPLISVIFNLYPA